MTAFRLGFWKPLNMMLGALTVTDGCSSAGVSGSSGVTGVDGVSVSGCGSSGISGSAGISGSVGVEGCSVSGLSVMSVYPPPMLQEARKHINTINIKRRILFIVFYLSEEHHSTEASASLYFVKTFSQA